MIDAILRSLPLAAFVPLRTGVVRLRRGGLPRKACVALLRKPALSRRGRLAREVTDIRPLDMPHLSFAPTDSMVIDAVYWFGVQGYEGRVADVWVSLCSTARSVLEVGGNIGLFSVMGGQVARGRYTVVEPLQNVANVLADNLARNRITKVELMHGAAIPGDEATDVLLNIPIEGREAPVGAQLGTGSETVAYERMRQERVCGLPFRGLVRDRDLIKIDAEGIEVDLLAAARDLIVSQRTIMLIELLQSSVRLAELLRELAAEMGFKIVIIPEYGTEKLVPVDPGAFRLTDMIRYNSKDVLLAPPDTVELLGIDRPLRLNVT